MSDDIKKVEATNVEEKLDKPKKKKAGNGGPLAKIIMIIIVVIIILGGLYFVDKYTNVNIFGMDSKGVSVTDWQAVFLTNGQVYFGKVASQNNDHVTLKNIYYLQVVEVPLQQTQTGEVATGQQTQSELSLVKLGNELHGPQDEMTINADHILFTEKLKSDSKVVDAIARYLAEQQ
ncbi:MAG: hypothetical protein ABH884_01525 [Candidatus Komeilibacteria bacterium]